MASATPMFESPYSRIRNIDWKPKSNEELLTQDGMKPFSLRVRWRSDLEYKLDFSIFSCMFLNPNVFVSNLNNNCSDLLDKVHIPYARHYNPLLIRNRSWILTIHKAKILRKKPLEKTFLGFKKWVKRIQTAGYNGARTVLVSNCAITRSKNQTILRRKCFQRSWLTCAKIL